MTLPKLENVQPLWSISHYDGVMSGIARYNSKIYWFHMLGNPAMFLGRRAYALYPLTMQEAMREYLAHTVLIAMTGNAEKLNKFGRCSHSWLRRKIPHWWWSWSLSVNWFVRGGYNKVQDYEKRKAIGYFLFEKR